jgi:hypothetical protein
MSLFNFYLDDCLSSATILYAAVITIAMLVCQLSSCQAGQCNAPFNRQLTMEKLAVNQLLATPLNNVTVTSALYCAGECLAVDTCAYITFSQSTNTCTLYSTATTSVSVAASLQVYAYNTKNIAVSLHLITFNQHTTNC